MDTRHNEHGMTLVEMLVVIAVLSLVLAGIYGLLTSAYQSYMHTRAKLESQQVARTALDYLVFRLREIDAGKITRDPSNCTHCHEVNVDSSTVDNQDIPCTQDVSVPQKAPDFSLKTVALTALDTAEVPAEYQVVTGNSITFKADLLPLHGFNESFTDSDGSNGHRGNGAWDWTAGDTSTDLDGDSEYDIGEPELLNDLNDNSSYDYFSEIWTLELQTTTDGPYYQLVETLNFSSISPDISKYNKSIYSNDSAGKAYFDAAKTDEYLQVPVAYGITGLKIETVAREGSLSTASGQSVDSSCTKTGEACHGSSGTINVYGDPASMNYEQFAGAGKTHSWWNIGGLSIEVTASNTQGSAFKREFTRLRQFVILRNLEVNQ